MHLYPASLLVTAAVFLPNLVFLALPPLNVEKYGKPIDPLALTLIERVGQVSSFCLPLFYPLSSTGPLVVAAWGVMAISLVLYYSGWIRFFGHGRDYVLLFRSTAGIPVPMAVCPVVVFLFASVVLGSIWQAAAAVVLGIGHITIAVREQRRIALASHL